MTIPKLVGLAEIAAMAGVSKQRVLELTTRPAFPDPVQSLAMGRVWLESDIRTFLEIPRITGRPKRNKPKTTTIMTTTGGRSSDALSHPKGSAKSSTITSVRCVVALATGIRASSDSYVESITHTSLQ